MATLSPPQMHALFDHLHTIWGGGQALFDVIHQGETSTRPESFLQNGPSQLLLDFYLALPDHQINIHQELTALSCFEIEVDNAALDSHGSLCSPQYEFSHTPAINLIPTVIFLRCGEVTLHSWLP